MKTAIARSDKITETARGPAPLGATILLLSLLPMVTGAQSLSPARVPASCRPR
jgi:hypothetical protein